MAELSASSMGIIAKQLKSLVRKPSEGVRYIADKGSLTEVHVMIAGPDRTPYEGGEFHVKLLLGSDYPAAPPKGFFLTKIFHPNISTDGSICVNTLKRDWKADIGLAHVLQVVRCLLIVPFPESSLNDDAGKLFMESYDEFARRARLMTGIHAKPAAAAGAGRAGAAAAAGGAPAAAGPGVRAAASASASSSRESAAAGPAAAAAPSAAAPSPAAAAATRAARKTTHDDGRGAAASNENKKARTADKAAAAAGPRKAAGDKKKAKGRKALKRL